MNETKVLSSVIKTSYTKPDILRRLRLYRSFLEHKFYKKGKKTLDQFLADASATSDDHEVIVGWGSEFHRNFTKETAYDILESVNSGLKTVPTLSLYLPFDPKGADVVKLGTWFRTNVDKVILLDIHSEPGLIGGMAFAWKGYYRDYSLRHYLMRKKKDIDEMFSRYAKNQ